MPLLIPSAVEIREAAFKRELQQQSEPATAGLAHGRSVTPQGLLGLSQREPFKLLQRVTEGLYTFPPGPLGIRTSCEIVLARRALGNVVLTLSCPFAEIQSPQETAAGHA